MSLSPFPVVLALALAVVAASAHAGPAVVPLTMPSGKVLQVEVMVKDEDRAMGLMFRPSLAPDRGMLFIFEPPPDFHTIWMKNCKVALDIIWLDQALQVVEIAHDRRPCPENGECPSFVPMRNAAYVLEVAAGTAREQNLGIGDRIQVLTAGSPSR